MRARGWSGGFAEWTEGRRALSPEQRLQAAVLEQAYDDLRRFTPAEPPHADARRWVDDETVDTPFAFEAICESLGISASYLRRGLTPRILQTPGDTLAASVGP